MHSSGWSLATVAIAALSIPMASCNQDAGRVLRAERPPAIDSTVSASLPQSFGPARSYASLNQVPVPATENEWMFEATRLSMAHGAAHFAGLKQRRPSLPYIKYRLLETIIPREDERALASFCEERGLEPESAYLHFANETEVEAASGPRSVPAYAPATAASSRVVAYIWDTWRYLVNPSSECARQYLARRSQDDVAPDASGLAFDGIFIDEASVADRGGMPLPATRRGGGIVEFGGRSRSQLQADSSYSAALVRLYAYVATAIKANRPGALLYPNTASFVSEGATRLGLATDGILTEFLSVEGQPYSSQGEVAVWEFARAQQDADRLFVFTQGTPDPPSESHFTKGNYPSARARHAMYALASYWMARSSRRLYFAQYPVWKPLSSYWIAAQEFDLGAPAGSYTRWREGSGASADSAGQAWRVFRRDFSNAIVLFRTRVDWSAANFASYGAPSPALELGGCFRLLHPDGSFGESVTSIRLALAEAAILVRCGAEQRLRPPNAGQATNSGWTTGTP